MRCGLLGRVLGHSYSPMIHGMLGQYSYDLFPTEPEALDALLRGDAWDGLNVTIPYKKTVVPYCAELSETAEKLGSVNTLVRRADGTTARTRTMTASAIWSSRAASPWQGGRRSCSAAAARR